ncbi:hypothetical protein HK098_002530 [Nowakowskiella sp. JEL0407]|nr:hypothetical protein HK098_002530 [Nowakowskiella sp. JEL0407]
MAEKKLPATIPNSAPKEPEPPSAASQNESAEKNSMEEKWTDLIPGFYAGLVRVIALKSAVFISTATVSLIKALAKWWFRFPIKLFRPNTFNSLFMFQSMAASDGKKLSVRYIRDVMKKEGIGFLGPNFFPLLVANGAVAAVLFNTYGSYSDYLSRDGFRYHHPFVAGYVAGLAQSILSTPLDNIQRAIDPSELVAQRSMGILRYTVRSIESKIPTKSPLEFSRFLFHALPYVALRDSLGFMMFFGVFEGLRKVGGKLAEDAILHAKKEQTSESNPYSPYLTRFQIGGYRASSVLFAGAMAGSAFQLVVYPLEQLRPLILKSETILEKSKNGMEAALDDSVIAKESKTAKHHHRYTRHFKRMDVINDRLARFRAVGEVIRSQGLRPFFAGIGPTIIRSMPASALALLAYELTLSDHND